MVGRLVIHEATKISEFVKTRKHVPSATIFLDRPDRRNALSPQIIRGLHQALEDILQERTVRAVILIGAGDVFSSGSDLHEIHNSLSDADALEKWHSDARAFQELIELMLRFPKPIVAAINGQVIGSAAALMLAADIVVAGENATVFMPESKRGLVSGIAAPLLAFRIGAGPTTRMLLSGFKMDSAAAIQAGLFHEVVADDLVWARSQALCEELAKGAQQSHQMTKRMINETIGEELFTQLSIGAANTATARTTEAAKEGVTAFVEKREPEW